jgi:hypothetical protein
MGWSAIATGKRNSWLHLGNYKGHWNKNGSLEIQFLGDKGQVKHQPFFIRAEKLLEPEQKTEDKQTQK